jgi:hypothetical protein
MDVEQAALEAGDERRPEDAHVAGEHDQVGPVALDFVRQPRVVRRAVGVVVMIERDRDEAAFPRRSEPGGLRPVADHGDDLDRQAGVGDRQEIAAAPRQQHDDRQVTDR